MTRTLTCLLLGDKGLRTFAVAVEADAATEQLKHLIKQARRESIQCDAALLDLFVARKSRQWLRLDDSDVTAMSNGDISPGIGEIMSKTANNMHPSMTVGNDAFGFPDDQGAADVGEIHVLVAPPGKRFDPSTWVHPARKRRWERLNEIACRAHDEDNDEDGDDEEEEDEEDEIFTGISEMLAVQPYSQARKRIDTDKIDELFGYLCVVSKVCDVCVIGRKLRAERLVFPFIACVCALLGDGVKLRTDATVFGDLVCCNVNFDYLIEHGKKRLCIVVAKKGCIRDGMLSRALVGGESLADVDDIATEEIHCIVTDFIDWYFSCLSLNKIEREHYWLSFQDGAPTRATVAGVAEKMYGMLAGAN